MAGSGKAGGGGEGRECAALYARKQQGAGRGGGVGFAREAAGDGTRSRGLKKTHNRVGRFAAAFESIQR